MSECLRVVIADDQSLVRAGFRMILDAKDDIEVAGEASDGTEAIAAYRRLRPDVILMDIRMPRLDGLEATRRILESEGGGCRILMLTTFDLDEYVYAALLAPSITRRLVERFARPQSLPAGSAQALASLTPRELEVLMLIARALSNAEIADALCLSDATVKTHVARILDKIGLRDRTQAVVFAYESGLVQLHAQKSSTS